MYYITATSKPLCRVIGSQSEIFCKLFSVLQETNHMQKIQTKRNIFKNNIITYNLLPFFMHGNKVPSLSTKVLDYGQSRISTLNPEERRATQKWIDLCRFEGKEVPEKITEEQFQYLISYHDSYSKKIKYLRSLFNKEFRLKEQKAKKLEFAEILITEKKEKKKENNGHIAYGIWQNTMFAKVEDSTIVHLHNHKAARAMIHGQPLIIDCSYDSHLSLKESNTLGKELFQVIAHNRCNQEPFNLYFCNYETDSLSYKLLKRNWPNTFLPDFPINITSKSYLDLFPKEKFIYLTPDSRNIMTNFDPDAIYIIGGIVDGSPKGPLSLAKAKMEGIKMMKLPLDRYHTFKKSKALGIDVVTEILLELQKSGDWPEAMRHIPNRLVTTYDNQQISPIGIRTSKVKNRRLKKNAS